MEKKKKKPKVEYERKEARERRTPTRHDSPARGIPQAHPEPSASRKPTGPATADPHLGATVSELELPPPRLRTAPPPPARLGGQGRRGSALSLRRAARGALPAEPRTATWGIPAGQGRARAGGPASRLTCPGEGSGGSGLPPSCRAGHGAVPPCRSPSVLPLLPARPVSSPRSPVLTGAERAARRHRRRRGERCTPAGWLPPSSPQPAGTAAQPSPAQPSPGGAERGGAGRSPAAPPLPRAAPPAPLPPPPAGPGPRNAVPTWGRRGLRAPAGRGLPPVTWAAGRLCAPFLPSGASAALVAAPSGKSAGPPRLPPPLRRGPDLPVTHHIAGARVRGGGKEGGGASFPPSLPASPLPPSPPSPPSLPSRLPQPGGRRGGCRSPDGQSLEGTLGGPHPPPGRFTAPVCALGRRAPTGVCA